VNVRHLGNGILAIDGLLDLDNKRSLAWLERIEAGSSPQAYIEVDDSVELNQGGYEFSKNSVDTRPTRFDNFQYDGKTEEDDLIRKLIDDAIYSAVVLYARVFPVSISELTWRTNGHIARYEPGQYIGSHSDCGLPYDGDTYNPLHIFPLYNTLTTTVALNDNYDGGELKFKTWGITHKGKVGSVTVYPSSYIGAHEILPVTSGVRYSYLSWFCHGLEHFDYDSMRKEDADFKWLVNLKKDVEKVEGLDFGYVPVGTLLGI
jgi:predicted 2-oxoglutarate/Fe(II)-dependent dioxygenase YbiX